MTRIIWLDDDRSSAAVPCEKGDLATVLTRAVAIRTPFSNDWSIKINCSMGKQWSQQMRPSTPHSLHFQMHWDCSIHLPRLSYFFFPSLCLSLSLFLVRPTRRRRKRRRRRRLQPIDHRVETLQWWRCRIRKEYIVVGSSLLGLSVWLDPAERTLIRLGRDRSSIFDHQFELVVGV